MRKSTSPSDEYAWRRIIEGSNQVLSFDCLIISLIREFGTGLPEVSERAIPYADGKKFKFFEGKR